MKAPRRILIISLSYFPKLVGGAEVAVKETTDRIDPGELDFEMLTLGDGVSPRTERVGNVLVHRITSNPGMVQKFIFPFRAFWVGKKIIARSNIAAVWSIMASFAGFTGFLLKKKFPQIPFLLSIQEGDNFERRQGIFKPVFKAIFKSADYIQAISNYLANWAKEMGATCEIKVVPNAVDFKAFSREIEEDEIAKLKGKFGKKDGDVFMITTSRLVAKNAVNDVIDALTFLPNNYKLLVLGSGEMDEELKQQTLRLGLNYIQEPPINAGNRVHFMGYVAHKDMHPYLAISDVFVRPSLSEGLGISYLEAMAAGIPVIATPVGGIPDFLKDGETGLFCEIKNPKSIAQKAEKFMKDVEAREYMTKQAKKLIKDKYQWERIATDIKKIIEHVID